MKKFLKYTLIGIASLVAILLLVAAIIPKEYGVERTIVIEKPRQQMFDFLRILKNQHKYDTWTKMDPNQKITYRGTDGEVGAICRWESEMDEVGVGEQEIIKIVANERIDHALRFEEPFEANDRAYYTFEDTPSGGTQLTWGYNGSMSYPKNLMLLFMDMESMIGDEFEKGLATLKQYAETNL